MSYNYSSGQAGHHPPGPPPPQHIHMPNQAPMQMVAQQGPNQMMLSSVPTHNIRQNITPGPPMGHQPQQPQQMHPNMMPMHQQQLHHMQTPPMGPQHHHHTSGNYQQLPLPPHSASPHHPSPHHTPNHITQPSPRPATGPSPHQPPMHQQSPNHLMGGHPIHGPPTPHLTPPQQMNQIGPGPVPSMLPPIVNQPNGPNGMHPQHIHHQPPIQNFSAGPGPIGPQHNNSPHFNSPNHGPPPPSMQPNGPPPHILSNSYISYHGNPSIDRVSPFPRQNIAQTEFRIIEFNRRLQNRPRSRLLSSPLLVGTIEERFWWEKFAYDFFDDNATLTYRLQPILGPPGAEPPKIEEYTIGRTLIPRFFKSYFDGEVDDLQLKLFNPREIHHHNITTLECDQADIITRIRVKSNQNTNHPMHVIGQATGYLCLDFVRNFENLLIKSWTFHSTHCREYIDRFMTTSGPAAYQNESVTRDGLTKSTVQYLKMCMIMEPMQELMLLHRQTKDKPKTCLRNILIHRYKGYEVVDDNAPQPNKRRKRKTPAATGATGNRKTKANANNLNAMSNNNNNNHITGFNNGTTTNNNSNSNTNSLMSPAGGNLPGVPSLSLASQDVMVVSEPAMLGTNFGDENERRITRLENNQFDSSSMSNSGNSGISNNVNNHGDNSMSSNNSMSQNSNHNQQLCNTNNTKSADDLIPIDSH